MAGKRSTIMPEELLAAAARCFERYSVRRATMNDIADEANVSRNTLYRFYSDRNALVADVLEARFIVVLEAMRALQGRYSSLEKAVVEISVFALQTLTKDPVIRDILENCTDRKIESITLNGTPAIREAATAVWQPLFKRARESGELTSGRSDERLIDGIRQISSLLTLRGDLDEDGQRRFLSDFLVPAIMRS